MEKLFDEYFEKFNEEFPLIMFMSKSNEEIIQVIKKCIIENQPVSDFNEDNNVKY